MYVLLFSLIPYVIVGTTQSRTNYVYRDILCLRVGGISKQVDKLTGKFAKLFKLLTIMTLT